MPRFRFPKLPPKAQAGLKDAIEDMIEMISNRRLWMDIEGPAAGQPKMFGALAWGTAGRKLDKYETQLEGVGVRQPAAEAIFALRKQIASVPEKALGRPVDKGIAGEDRLKQPVFEPNRVFPIAMPPPKKGMGRRHQMASIYDDETEQFVVVPLEMDFGNALFDRFVTVNPGLKAFLAPIDSGASPFINFHRSNPNGAQALEFAKDMGLEKFPTFGNREDARDFMEVIQGGLRNDGTMPYGFMSPMFEKARQPLVNELDQHKRNFEEMVDPKSNFAEEVDSLHPLMRSVVFGNQWSGQDHIDDTKSKIDRLETILQKGSMESFMERQEN